MYKDLSKIVSKGSKEKTVIQIRVAAPKKYFFLVVNRGEHFLRVQYFTKVVVANHFSINKLFLRRALATINCIYKMNLTALFQVDFYFKGALAAIHLRGTTIVSGGQLQ